MKLILADSNELVRIGIRSVLKAETQVQIVGEAKSNDELIEMLRSFGADVIVMDYTAAGFTIDVLAKIKSEFSNVHILAITPEQPAQILVDSLRAGVTSYVKKDCSIPEIIDAVKETLNGNRFFCGQILEAIQEANLNIDDIHDEAFSCEAVLISKRECEIIVLISEGNTNVQIADKLFLSSHTVNTHRKNIMSKLGVKNTAGIVMYAVKTNLVSPNKFLFTADNSI